MIRKDYELIAHAIRDRNEVIIAQVSDSERIVLAVAIALKRDNPNFNYAQFKIAAGF